MPEPQFHALLGSSGTQDLTISTTAISLTIPAALATQTANSGRAVIQCRTADILFNVNGVDPTAADATTGDTLFRNAILTVYGIEMSQLRMIRATSTNGVVHVRYERGIV